MYISMKTGLSFWIEEERKRCEEEIKRRAEEIKRLAEEIKRCEEGKKSGCIFM